MKKYSAILALTATSGLLQVGHGAASSLMVQQGGRLEFSETTLGLLVTATYVGFLGSNLILYRLLPRVSYIRTFAVCAAVMTSLALLMPLLPTEAGWIALRLAHGAFFCAAIIVCDGWLNTNATNQDRNKLVGVFTAVNYLAYGAGQYILVLGNRDSDHAFMLSALFIAMCLVPMCLTRFAEPQPPPRDRSAGLSWRDAYAIAPVAFLGQFAFGVYSGSSWLFIRYLDYLEIPAEKQGSLAAVFFGCGFILQIPVGWMADKMRDRRDMIIIVASASSACALMLGFAGALPYWALMCLAALLGSISATLFALNIAYGQDFVERSKSPHYSGILLRSYAVGGLIGPPIAGFLMSAISPNMLFVFCAMALGGVALMTATNRLMPRYRPARSEQFQPMTPLTATQAAVAEPALYSETDIGPDLQDAAPPAAEPETDIGPDLPEDAPAEPETAPSDVGPELPEKE